MSMSLLLSSLCLFFPSLPGAPAPGHPAVVGWGWHSVFRCVNIYIYIYVYVYATTCLQILMDQVLDLSIGGV